MANRFLERHRSLSIAAFLAFLVLLGLSCVYLRLTGGLGSVPQPTPVPLDITLLTSDSCQPPCWQGLTPGISTEEEVNEFVRTSQLVDQASVYRGDITRGSGEVVGVSIQWHSTGGRGRGYYDFAVEGGVLENITINPQHDVTLERLIERYGPPEKFHVMVTGLHLPLLRVTLFYPEHGFTATLDLPVDDPELRPESTIIQVWYSQAGSLETFIELGISYLGSYLGTTPEQWSESLRDWPGYGAIEVP